MRWYLICCFVIIHASAKLNSVLDEKSISASLREVPCVPTAVVKGPCHVCVCDGDGTFQCTTVNCEQPYIKKVKPNKREPECESNKLYREGILWCRCNSKGFWKAENCRSNYLRLGSKPILKQSMSLPSVPCESDSSYVVDCNICQCRNGKFAHSACTSRSCAKGHKADDCSFGDFLRTGNQLCACSKLGIYVDKLCIDVAKEPAHKISTQNIEALMYEHNAKFSNFSQGRCVPNTVIQKDCNKCRCTEEGVLVCTSNICEPQDNEIKRAATEDESSDESGEISDTIGFPELESENDKCTPGRQYKVKCNTCHCLKNGELSCTTMLCLEDFNQNKNADKLTTQSIANLDPNLVGGQNCTVGKVYKVECNVCKCSPAQRLICTKKVCLNSEQQAKLLDVGSSLLRNEGNKLKKKSKGKKGKKVQPSKVVADTVVDKDILNNNNNEIKGDKTADTKTDAKKSVSKKTYPELPSTKCEPGGIYMRGCQRCFCNEKGTSQCTNKKCDELKGPVKTPEDVRPSIPKLAFEKLPFLNHEAEPCEPGVAYRIACNSCICLKNKNLLCGNLLCLSPAQMNRIAARKEQGKPCDSSYVTPPEQECIFCSCKKGLVRCHAKPECEPPLLRRALHGTFPAKIEAHSLKPESAKCIPGMVYREKCNYCYCQGDGSLRCTRKGCLNFNQVQKLKHHINVKMDS